MDVRRKIKGKYLCLPVVLMMVALVFLGVTAAQKPGAEPTTRAPDNEPTIYDPMPVTGPDGVVAKTFPDDWNDPKDITITPTSQYTARGSGFHSGAYHV